MNIRHNIDQLTEEEKAFILNSSFFTYTYGVGLIFLEKGSWDCTDSVGALAFLRSHGIKEI